MEMIIAALSGICCLSGLVVAVVAAVILSRRSKGGADASEGPAPSGPKAVEPPASSSSPFPASASADLSSAGPGASLVPRAGGEVEDFDEDGPTTLVDTAARRPAVQRPVSPFSPTPTQAPTENIRRSPMPPAHEPLAPTERIQAPPRSSAAGRPPRSSGFGHVPAPDEPPPLPRSHAGGPPSSRRLHLDPGLVPDTSTLQPGATIIPPDDWNDDYIDDDEADETMLMARPPLPPKK